MEAIWTIDGDETSWTSWAENMAQEPASLLVQELIAANKASQQEWAVDIGCGAGRAFIPLAEAGYRVIGLDPTARGLQLSRQRARQSHINAYSVQASAAQFPLPPAFISFAFAFGTLFHLSIMELTSALQEIKRVLHPDGKALLHFLDLEDWRRSLAREIPPEQAPVPGYGTVITCFCSQNQIQEWIERTALKLVSLELRTSTSESGQQRNWLAQCRRYSD